MNLRVRQSFTGFSQKEKERRWQRVREFMRNQELDALVVSGVRPGVLLDNYLSNWLPGSTVVFPLKGEPTLLDYFGPEMIAVRPDMPLEARPWIEDIRAGARGAIITAVLKEKGLERARVGVVGIGPLRTDWEGWIPYGTWNRVVKRLPDCKFEDVSAAFGELVIVKSAEELEAVRQAARVLEQASVEMTKAAGAGVSEVEVYAAFQRALHENGVYAPFQILRSGPDAVSWGEPPWLFGVGAPRVLQPGDVVVAEIFATVGCMEAQVQMAVAIPPVSPEDKECAQLARQGYEAGLKNLRPGKTFAEVVAAMESVLDRAGVWYLTPQIHNMNPMLCIGPTGVRFETMPGFKDYRQLGPSHIRGGEVVLQPGMVFELEPNACIGRHRVNIGGTAIVTEGDAEELNKIPTYMQIAER
ncbi:MAG: aminopeptidase P family protein [Chloroflexi bacterium]|nr:aminopeptidase P family protein [Chloroflexota bacterium]